MGLHAAKLVSDLGGSVQAAIAALLLVWLVRRVLRIDSAPDRRLRDSAATVTLVVIGCLVRSDFVIVVVVAGGWLIVRRRVHAGAIVAIAGVAITLATSLWRHLTFGQWVPNTYSLKLTGSTLADRVPRGLLAAAFASVTGVLPLLLLLLGVVALVGAGIERDPRARRSLAALV